MELEKTTEIVGLMQKIDELGDNINGIIQNIIKMEEKSNDTQEFITLVNVFLAVVDVELDRRLVYKKLSEMLENCKTAE